VAVPLNLAPRRILLIHFGQLGDAVLALPAARALRAHFPNASLTLLAARGPHAVFALAGFPDVWTADRVRWKRSPLSAAFAIPRLLARLRRARFDLSVDLHSYKETNLLAALAGIPTRVAMLRPTRSWPRLITLPPPPDDPDGRLLDRYCQVLLPLGIAVPAAARIPALDLALEPQLDPPTLGICPGAGHPSRRWPADRFAALARHLAAPTLVFAGPEESEALLAPFATLPHCTIRRGLSLPQLAAQLARCRAVVSNATGPAHLAAAAGARVLVLGEIPAFDPVPRPPRGTVSILRKPHDDITSISLAAAQAALTALWSA
jgi:heptosyltransferase-1